MAGICTSRSVCSGGNHNTLTVTLDGEAITIPLLEADAQLALTADEKALLVRLTARRMRSVKGWAVSTFLNRCTLGDEAINMRHHDLIAAGSAVTKTNIGTSYVDILPGANGCRDLVDFTGCTEYRLILTANLIGTGQWGARVVRDSDSVVLHENANLGAAGERELDTGWLTLPAAFQGAGEVLMRGQMKSQTAADDPVVRRLKVMVR